MLFLPPVPSPRAAKNIPTVRATMKKLRDVIGYFGQSTQANTKLLNFQSTSGIEEYSNSRPKKLIQDVVTRWWSTHASNERALHLQKAIKGLIATSQVTCEVLMEDEWRALGEIEAALRPLAFFQSVLEGESYVSGSLVPLAMFNIRRQLNDIVDDQGTMDGVRKLATALLDDFDIRFKPNKDDNNLLTFSWGAVVGFRKRYNGSPLLLCSSVFGSLRKDIIEDIHDVGRLEIVERKDLQFNGGWCRDSCGR